MGEMSKPGFGEQGSPESLPAPVMEAHLAFTVAFPPGTSEQIAAWQARIAKFTENLGGSVLSQAIVVPERLSEEDYLRQTLDSPFIQHDLFAGVAPQTAPRSIGILHSQGIKTVRDLLVLGSEKLGRFDDLGPKTMYSLKANITALPIPYTLEARPSIEMIAALCDGLDQVPLQVIRRPFNDCYDRLGGPRITIADVLNGDVRFRNLLQVRNPAVIVKRAQEFADKFNEAKRRMGGE